jgi:hypothetical protein
VPANAPSSVSGRADEIDAARNSSVSRYLIQLLYLLQRCGRRPTVQASRSQPPALPPGPTCRWRCGNAAAAPSAEGVVPRVIVGVCRCRAEDAAAFVALSGLGRTMWVFLIGQHEQSPRGTLRHVHSVAAACSLCKCETNDEHVCLDLCRWLGSLHRPVSFKEEFHTNFEIN